MCSNKVTNIVVTGANLHRSLSLSSQTLTFVTHALAVRRVCNYHIWALRHIRYLLTHDVAKTLPYYIVGARLDYFNSSYMEHQAGDPTVLYCWYTPGLFQLILYGAPSLTLSKMQRVQNSLSLVVLLQPKQSHAGCSSSHVFIISWLLWPIKSEPQQRHTIWATWFHVASREPDCRCDQRHLHYQEYHQQKLSLPVAFQRVCASGTVYLTMWEVKQSYKWLMVLYKLMIQCIN